LILAIQLSADGASGWIVFRIGIVIAILIFTLWLLKYARRIGAIMLILCGTIGVIAGIVFGLRFLQIEGINWRSIGGLLELISGLILLAAGFKRLLSGVHLIWKLVTIPLVLIVLLFLGLNMVPAVLAVNVPRIPAGREMPADYGLKAVQVRFAASDGVDLFAWYIPSSNGANIVLRHGSGSTGASVLNQAAVLARHGYGVLVTDARGHGNSRGRAMDFGWYGELDIDAAVTFLARQPALDVRRIALVGLSMGGEEAIGAAGQDSKIAAVVAEGATGRTCTDKSWMSEKFGFRGRVQSGLEYLEYGLAGFLSRVPQPKSLAESAHLFEPRPILLITAGKVEDELAAAGNIQKGSPSNVTIWNIPEAGHTQGLMVRPAEWENRVTAFLDAALRPR
jgi:pimeloyl-ACP methyl ester carboxylesterase